MLKKGLMLALSFVLFASMPFGALAAGEESLQITVNTMPKVDVSLALGVTNDDGTRFEADLTRLLKERGLDPSVLSIQALESRDEQTFQGKFKMQIYWNEPGRTDMDSHMYFRDAYGSELGHVYYGNKNYNGSTLDIDDTNGGTGEWSTIDFDRLPSNVNEVNFQVYGWSGNATTSVRLFREMNGMNEKVIDWSTLVRQGSYTNFGSLKRNVKGGWDFHYAATGQVFPGSQTVVTARAFTDVLREPVWRDGSERFIVNMNNSVIPDFDSPTALGEILTRLTNESIGYVGVGSNTNEAQSKRFIARNDNKGMFTNSDKRTYNQYMNDIADYIREQVRVNQTSGSSQYALVDQQIDLEVIPREFKTNTETVLFPNGRWRLDHNENWFENNNGKYTKSGIYQPNLDFQLEKVGRYELWFGDLHPEPRYLYIHRKPVASYQVALTPNGTNRNLTIRDYSYDLDGQTSTSDGIAEREWKWKKTTDANWTNGMPPAIISSGQDYIVQLRVKDYQDQWSDAVANYVTSNSSVIAKPIANFDAPFEELVYNPVTIRDISYDPAGRTITQREWKITNADTGAQVFTGTTPPSSFSPYGKGKYSISLRVKNDQNIWSEPFKRTINIVVDDVAPIIDINKSDSDWVNQNVNVTATFDDKGGSGFRDQRFAVTTSSSKPGSGWSAWGGGLKRDISIADEGVRYIHIEARDNEGNLAYKVFGPYKIDKVKPTLRVMGDLVSPTHDDVQLYFDVTDNMSGIASVTVNGQSIPLNALTYPAKNNGRYDVKVTDKAGNVFEETVIVANIDKEITFFGPDVSNLGNIQIEKMAKTVSSNVSKMTVNDWREGSNNWRIDVSATDFVSVSDPTKKLEADIRLKGVNGVRRVAGTGSVPVSSGTMTKSINGTTQSLATANGARGSYDFTFPTNAFEVTIDPTKVKVGAYRSTVTWSVVVAPQ